MAENKLLIGSISLPANTDVSLRLALEDMVRKVDDTLTWLYKPSITSLVANTTLTDLDSVVLVNATSGSKTITLPDAGTVKGKQLKIKKTDASANAVVVDGEGTQKIDGALTYSLATQNKYCALVSDGSAWHVVANN